MGRPRLKRASFRLAFRDERSVLEVALDSGFEGPEAPIKASGSDRRDRAA